MNHMHRHRMLSILALMMAFLPVGAGAQLFTDFDWLLHRGTPDRYGRNAGDNLAVPTVKTQLWVYPPTSLMPAEMVVNNGNISYGPTATGQSATGVDTPGNPWLYSPAASADRGPGAWPPSDANPL